MKVMAQEQGDGWVAYNGDSCEVLKGIPDNSIDLAIYSPPFASLFTYTNSERDLGNSRDWDEFFEHYAFIIRETLRVTKPGRINCVHTSDIPAMKSRDGFIGMRDFPGAVIRAHEQEGWVYHGKAVISKNPQMQAQRVRAKGLGFNQLRRDASWIRPALIDQVLIFRKAGINKVSVKPVASGELNNEIWIEWANGIWMHEVDQGLLNRPVNTDEDWLDWVYAVWLGISEGDVLRYAQARAIDDERHVAPLQIETITRCVKLWSNPGETILDPFGGIGSTGYVSIKYGRKSISIELKESYFDIMINNLREAERKFKQVDLFEYAKTQEQET